MSRFKKVIEDTQLSYNQTETAKPDYTVPIYSIDGKTKYPGSKVIRMRGKKFILIVVFLLAFLYIPQLFISDNTDDNIISDILSYQYNSLMGNVILDSPDEDYDNDGLTNAQEDKNSTDLFQIDTDGDGLSDSYEVLSGSNPNKYEKTLLKLQKEWDKESKISVSEPYKIGNVILWAGSYEAKAYGSVVETPAGYRFTDFKGNAQFPNHEQIYVYEVKNGVHKEIKKNLSDNTWKIHGDMEVEIYSEPLDEVVELGFLGNTTCIRNNSILNIVAEVLPDKGILTAEKKTIVDVETNINNIVQTDICKIKYDKDDYMRLAHNDINLNDLSFVRDALEDGACILTSLYSYEYGEAVVIVYGYTTSGDLLIADAETLEPVGILDIDIKSKKLLKAENEVVSYTYFDFYGFGFDSSKGDNISFFAASKNSESYISHFSEYSKNKK